jgi:hypothetical protein
MSEFFKDTEIPRKESENPEDFIDELDSLKDILDSEFESDLLTSEDELEKAIADALEHISDEAPLFDPTPSSMPPLRDESRPEPEPAPEAATELTTAVAGKPLETVPEIKEAVKEPENANIPPLLDEVVFSGDQLPGEAQELMAALNSVDNDSPMIGREEVEILIETVIAREMPRLREELKEKLMAEMQRLLPNLQ